MRKHPPKSDQIELTLFGPGYGECAVVHLGENRWIVVDSCINMNTGNPVVLEYFNTMELSIEEAVHLIVVSHWDDDHIRGLSKVISSCPKTPVCCSKAFTKKEFLEHILSYHNLMIRGDSTGVNEITKTLDILRGRDPIKWASANKTVLRLPAQSSASPCVVTTLSPSDEEYENFLLQLAREMPEVGKTKIRARSLRPNNTAIALWIEVGQVKILLGSDLEEKGQPFTGWSAIVKSQERPPGRASIFKVPHHGSKTGHHDQVWTDLLDDPRIAILSPYSLAGKKLPTDKDLVRILTFAPESYITTHRSAPKIKKDRPSAVERTIRETVGKLRAAQPPMGSVSLRNGGSSDPLKWDVKLSPSGAKLSDIKKLS